MLGLVCAVFAVLGAVEAWRDGPTFDEPLYVYAGLTAVRHGDLSVNDEHPPLAKVLAALPTLGAGVRLPPGRADQDDEWNYGRAFVRQEVRNGQLRRVIFLSRLVPIAETIGVALLLLGFGADLLGVEAGLVAAVLWLASPLVLGIGHLNGTDVPFTLAVVGWAWALLRWRRDPRPRRLAVLGLLGGLAALADDDGLLMIGLAALVVAAHAGGGLGRWRARSAGSGEDLAARRRERRARARRMAKPALAIILLGLVVIWIPYIALDPGGVRFEVLPAQYVSGAVFLAKHDTPPTTAYLLGHAWNGDRPWYWPAALAVKLPPTTFLLLLAVPFAWRRLADPTRREMALAVGLPGAVLGLLDLAMTRDIGVRYALPGLALAFVGAGGLVRVGGRRARAVVGLAVGVAVVMTVLSFPDSVAWTDPIFGGQPYQVATDADSDWGQGWFALQRWSARHPGAFITYFGARGLGPVVLTRARSIPSVPERADGWVAASATEVTTQKPVRWLRAYCPVAVLDETILVYRFATPPSARPSPAKPPAPCRGRFSVPG